MLRLRLAAALCALLGAFSGGGPAWAAGSAWRMLKTPRYTVVSQLPDGATAAWAADFDQFIESMGGLMKINPALLPPLTVVLMARDKDFEPYKPPRPNGSVAKNIAGFFYRTEGWGVIGLAEQRRADDSYDQTRRTIYHESVHWLMSTDRSPQPRWFSEGIAELFSTFEPRITKVEWGHPISSHVLLLRGSGLQPMKAFLAEDSSIFDRDDHTGRYYAQSWALMHYLLVTGHPERRDMLAKYIDAYRTKSADESFRIAFGGDYAALEKALHNYVDEPRMGYMITPRHPAAPPVPITDAPPLLVELALGRLALSASDHGLASRHAAQAQALAPNEPAGHELRAAVALRDDDRKLAGTEAQAAVAAGSHDATMFLVAAEALALQDDGDRATLGRRRAGLYENAINSSPRNLSTYKQLVSALMSVDRPTDEDARFLDVGRRIYPQEGFIQIGLAQVAQRQGRTEEALQRIDDALGVNLNDDERRFGRNLHDRWLLEPLGRQVHDALSRRQPAEALALLDRIGPRVLDDDGKHYVAQLRTQAQLQDLAYQADAAARAKHVAEARALFEKLLAHPDADPGQQQYARRALEALKSAK